MDLEPSSLSPSSLFSGEAMRIIPSSLVSRVLYQPIRLYEVIKELIVFSEMLKRKETQSLH